MTERSFMSFSFKSITIKEHIFCFKNYDESLNHRTESASTIQKIVTCAKDTKKRQILISS